jgi:hypothetical protein
MAKYYTCPYSSNNLKDPSLFVILFSLVVMSVLSSLSSNIVGGGHDLNAQAQVIENDQQIQQQQAPSPLSTPPQTGMMPAIKITSHSSGQQVNTGPLTISGTSSDTPSTNCEVYADWNDSTPFGKAIAAGPGGHYDYSKWTFTYDSGSHLIQNGTNNLTSKISCLDGPTNLTKWNSVNLIGVNGLDSGSTINQAITSGLTPSPSSSIVGLPLPTPGQADLTSPPLDPVVGEADEEDEEDEEDNENDEADSDDSSEEDNEEDNNEEEEDQGSDGSGDEGSDNGDEDENSGGGDNNNGPVNFGPDGPVNFGPDGPVD